MAKKLQREHFKTSKKTTSYYVKGKPIRISSRLNGKFRKSERSGMMHASKAPKGKKPLN